ncbi:hypothetical protein IKQ26_02600 [bacterium]|nr:hypothetical protein [bacterium]
MKFDIKYPSATFKNTKMCLTFFSIRQLDKINLHESRIAYKIRYSLFNQYKNANQYFPKDEYSGIGLFYLVDDEYNLFKNKEIKHTNEFNSYKEKYIRELDKILSEYYERNTVKARIANRTTWQTRVWAIPNRINLYQKLSLSYIYNSDLSANKNSLKKLKSILVTNDSIINETKLVHFPTYSGATFSKEFKQRNPQFLFQYSTNIIRTENKLIPEVICDDKFVIDKYIESIDLMKNNKNKSFNYILYSDTAKYINDLLKNKCHIK